MQIRLTKKQIADLQPLNEEKNMAALINRPGVILAQVMPDIESMTVNFIPSAPAKKIQAVLRKHQERKK